jgi:hypothetical protein
MPQDCSYHESKLPFILNFHETRIRQMYIYLHISHNQKGTLIRAPQRNLITRIRTVVFGYVRNVYGEQLSRTVAFVYAWYAVFTSSGYLNKNLKQNGPKKYSKCCLKLISPFLIVSGGQASSTFLQHAPQWLLLPTCSGNRKSSQ